MLPKGLLKEYGRTLLVVIGLVDMATIFFAGFLAYLLRFNQLFFPSTYTAAMAIGVVLTPLVFSFFNIYDSIRGEGFLKYSFKIVQGISVLSLMLAGLAFFTKSGDAFSRTWFLIWMLNSFVLLMVSRGSLLMLLRFMRSHGLNERRVIIFGANELGRKFATNVQQALWTGFRIISFIDDEAHTNSSVICNIPVIQTPDNLSAFLTQKNVDEFWIALPLSDEARVKNILHILRHHTVNTRFVLDIFSLDLMNHSITDIAGFPVLNIRSTPMMGINRIVKAIEDRLLAAIILLLISPLVLLIALLVKLSSKGPVFFKQERLGWDGRIIKVYKFRTMVQHQEKSGQVTQATIDDKRITPIGKFLRRCSLDELPQFINVLQGRMSIVGPRPHALAHNELYKEAIYTYMQRHRVKPGITGWAQINGWRGETDTLEKMQKRVEYDMYYINNWSLSFDIKIILLTIIRGFISRNAY